MDNSFTVNRLRYKSNIIDNEQQFAEIGSLSIGACCTFDFNISARLRQVSLDGSMRFAVAD